MYYPDYFEMGEYAGLPFGSPSECAVAVLFSLTTSSQGVAVSASKIELLGRVCHLINKIYREMLCTTRYEGMSHIITGPPGGLGPDQASRISCTPQYGIVLSWDLLDYITIEGKTPFSFTNFITTLELSGPLYISPGIYHTQITEYSLHTVYR